MDRLSHQNTSTSRRLQVPQSQQYRKTIIELQKSLIRQKQKNKQLEGKILSIQKRTIQRQKQFHLILNKIDQNAFKFNFYDLKGTINSQLDFQKIHKQIMNNMQTHQLQAKQHLQSRYKQNLGIMERRIQQITTKMEFQINKTHKLSEAQHGELKNQINLLQKIALQIDHVNSQFMIKNQKLQFRINILNQQKQLLIEQLTSKKMMLQKYHQKCKNTIKRQTSNKKQQNRISRNISCQQKWSKQIITKPSTSVAISKWHSNLQNEPKNPNLTSINVLPSKLSFLSNDPKKSYISSMSITLNPNKTHENMIPNQKYIENSINSLKQVLAREKQKKIEYQKSFLHMQQVVRGVQRVVNEGLLNVRHKQEGYNQTTNNKPNNTNNYQLNSQPTIGILQIKRLLNKIKNIISGNDQPQTQQIISSSITMDLLKLLDQGP